MERVTDPAATACRGPDVRVPESVASHPPRGERHLGDDLDADAAAQHLCLSLSETRPTSSGASGHPEAFSLWVFIFFNPEACAVPFACGPGDLTGNPAVVAGAFNAGGHLAAGPHLTMSGRVTEQSLVFPPQASFPLAETLRQALDEGYAIADAEIHLAVAPHGGLDPDLLPAQTTTPAGNPSY
jgi:hypothetical protein